MKTMKSAIIASALLSTALSPEVGASDDHFDPTAIRKFMDRIESRSCEGRLRPTWSDNGQKLLVRGADTPISRVNPNTGSVTPLVTIDAVRKALEPHLPSAQWNEKDLLSLQASDNGDLLMKIGQDMWRFKTPYSGGDLQAELLSEEQLASMALQRGQRLERLFPFHAVIAEVPSNDGKTFITRAQNQIGIRKAGTAEATIMTQDGSPEILYKAAGNRRATAWSSDDRYFVAERTDMTDVHGFPVVDWQVGRDAVEFGKLDGTEPGAPAPDRSFHIFDSKSGKSTKVNLSQGNGTFWGWRPDSDEAWFSVGNPFGKVGEHYQIWAVNAKTGTARVVMEDKRVDGPIFRRGYKQTGLIVTFHPDGQHFFYLSDEDGRFGLYLHKASGKRLRKVTPDEHLVLSPDGFDVTSGRVFYHAHSDPKRPLDTHFHYATLDGSDTKRLTTLPGQHAAQLSPDFSYFIDVHEDLDRPAETQLVSANGRKIAVLASNQAETETKAGWSFPETFTVKAADGVTDMMGVLIKPRNFDPKNTYPVVQRIYGGQQLTVVPRYYMAWECGGFNAQFLPTDFRLEASVFADRGYAVAVIDSPGTPERGREYANARTGEWPLNVVQDHLAGIKELTTRYDFLNEDQVLLEGGSNGGYMTIRALIEGNGYYKAAASSVPWVHPRELGEEHEGVFNGNSKEVAVQEEKVSLLNKVGQLQGDLLLLGAAADAIVPVSNTMTMLESLTRAGKPYDLVLFPHADHLFETRDGRKHLPYATAAKLRFYSRSLRDD